jgi:UDP-N-acetylmuramate--alanine ligase
VLPRVDRKVITYGLSSDADVMASEVEVSGLVSSFVVHAQGRKLGRVRLPLPGRHAVYNGLAAVAVGLELDVAFRTIANALREFRGVDRRLQQRGMAYGATVLDDYGHHPTEIAATLAAVREGFGARTVVLFQPHRYSRTRALLEEFGGAFFLADHVIVTEVYAAGEPPLPGVDGSIIAESLVRHGHPSVVYEPRARELSRLARRAVRDGDILLTLGAGDIWKVGEALVRAGNRRRGRKKSAPRRKKR